MLLLAKQYYRMKLYESFYVNINREIYMSIFFSTFVKNEFCNRIINSMDWLYSISVTFCIEQLHQVFQSACLEIPQSRTAGQTKALRGRQRSRFQQVLHQTRQNIHALKKETKKQEHSLRNDLFNVLLVFAL